MAEPLGPSSNRGSGDFDPEELEEVRNLVCRERVLHVHQSGRQDILLERLQMMERRSSTLVELLPTRFALVHTAAASAEANLPRTCSAGWTFWVHPSISYGFLPRSLSSLQTSNGACFFRIGYLKTSAEPIVSLLFVSGSKKSWRRGEEYRPAGLTR